MNYYNNFTSSFRPYISDPYFCPGTFTTNGVCAHIDCEILGRNYWPKVFMPHNCTCEALGNNQSRCACLIICLAK
ncbi:hypothetical protein H5410_042935 [Solanum commersonii]|uniref:Uncharacterized protein n=1 Tax=Solanum commersonii TaxID=4109 RepID=A0A9J5XX09_SOLCO|nr:hypothetical protein H5410_042935 [Solanum commersonii]